MGNQKLTVRTEAQVVKLTLSGTRCTGLDFLLDGQLHSVGASREVVLCAGAIHTPRLLLLSGIGPQDDLEQLGIDTVVHLPGVGRNLARPAQVCDILQLDTSTLSRNVERMRAQGWLDTLVRNAFTTPIDAGLLTSLDGSRVARLDDHPDGYSPIDGKQWSASGSIQA